jgi:hypothetical protein
MAVLVLPGYGDSGPAHWQTLWQSRYGYERVAQADWTAPQRDDWVRTLDHAVRHAAAPVTLVAHSLGCILVAHWARTGVVERVSGALLVAPPDVDEIQYVIPEIESFAPVPLDPLPFPSIVVLSATDPYVTPERARRMAAGWGATAVDIGDAGHVNAESDLGEWADGHRLLDALRATS